MPNRHDFDAIVIGSGMGALSFASIMARLSNWRVLVLERHFKIGGFTHSFTRPGGWSWDVGLHYVGRMGEGTRERQLFDFVTQDGVKWNSMPEFYENFIYPGLRFRVPKGEARFQEALSEAFPKERGAIKQYFRDLNSAVSWHTRHLMESASPAPLSSMIRVIDRLTSELPLTVTRRYLETRFGDAGLRAVVASQWGDYGLPPGQSAFVTHAILHLAPSKVTPCGAGGTPAPQRRARSAFTSAGLGLQSLRKF